MEEIKENSEKKRSKNLISIIILLMGLLVGSLFVDVMQLFKGGGFSQKNLNKTDVFEANGKTWAAFSEPIVNVIAITDDNCEACNPSDVLVWSRRVMPTLNAQKVDFDSEEGKRLIKENEIKFLPALIFSNEVSKTDFYSQAQVLFMEKNGQFVMNTQELGLEPGKYIEVPVINEEDAAFGNKESQVKVVIFSDFQCPYCKSFYGLMRNAMKEFGERVFFDIKHLPLEIHPKAQDAALASLCAKEQGKYWEYADKLYADQASWANVKNNQVFKNYASNLRLKYQQFSDCMDNQKYKDQIENDKNEALKFNIVGTPAIFVNNNFQTGIAGYAEFKQAIESELSR